MTEQILTAAQMLKLFVDRILTFSRSAAFAGWLIGAWGILAPDNEFHWPLTRGILTALVGLTIATFGRSVLAAPKSTVITMETP